MVSVSRRASRSGEVAEVGRDGVGLKQEVSGLVIGVSVLV